MKRLMILTIALWWMCTAVWCQVSVVSGHVVSATTGEHIKGASVRASGTGIAVVANDDGFFSLKTSTKFQQLEVSHLGYFVERVQMEGRDASHLVIALRPTSIQLQELLVTVSNARELVDMAIERIPQNYSRQPQLYHCFYRESAMKRQHYISVAEGIVDMYKTGYISGTGRDRVAILKGRRLLSAKTSDTLSVKVLGGPVGAVSLDVVKNPDVLLNPKELSYYEMQMETPVSIDDRRQYVVSLEPRVVTDYALNHCKLYIDQETLAFTRVIISLDMANQEKATRAMLVKKPAGVRFRPKEMSLLVDYRRDDDGMMHLSYQRMTFRFNCDWRRKLLTTSFTAVCELAVTSKATADDDLRSISGRNSFDSRDAFFDKVEYFRDPKFWLDYNIIEPTESLDKAVERLLKKR